MEDLLKAVVTLMPDRFVQQLDLTLKCVAMALVETHSRCILGEGVQAYAGIGMFLCKGFTEVQDGLPITFSLRGRQHCERVNDQSRANALLPGNRTPLRCLKLIQHNDALDPSSLSKDEKLFR